MSAITMEACSRLSTSCFWRGVIATIVQMGWTQEGSWLIFLTSATVIRAVEQAIQFTPKHPPIISSMLLGVSQERLAAMLPQHATLKQPPNVLINGLSVSQERLAAMLPQLAQPTGPGGCTWMQWAFACVRSRVFQLGPNCYALVPFLDMANHAVAPHHLPKLLRVMLECWTGRPLHS